MKIKKRFLSSIIALMLVAVAIFSDFNVIKANAASSAYPSCFMFSDSTFETLSVHRTIAKSSNSQLYYKWYHYYERERYTCYIYNSNGTAVASAEDRYVTGTTPSIQHLTLTWDTSDEATDTYTVKVYVYYYSSYGVWRESPHSPCTTYITLVDPCTSHDWDDGTVTKAATCTEDGTKKYTCSVCEETKTETLPMTGHSWDGGTVTSEGELIYTCTNCGETKTVSVQLIKNFVTRLYEVCLDREPDDDGLNNWVKVLASGEQTGVDVASGFIFSTEFSNHNYCNSCYVEHLYNAFMGRSSDPDGKAYWINNLETGMTREEVFNGFALSPEFKNICDEYGIVQGEGLTIPEYGTVPKGSCSADGTVDGVTSFVTRLYNVCLDRDPDATGLSNWTNALWNHETSGSTTAQGFIFSPEFTNKNYDDDTYVEYLYRAFFDRASDPTGKADWVSKLQNGASREEVFNGFTGSQEFMTLCAKYGIVR